MREHDPYVYFIEIAGHGLVKIGTSANPIRRELSLRSWSPFPLTIRAQASGGRLAEAFVQDEFRASCHQGEWFYLTAQLKEYIAEVNRAGSLPFGSLTPTPHGQALTRRCDGLLAKVGKKMRDVAPYAGVAVGSTHIWASCGIPHMHVPAVVRLMADHGHKIHPTYFLAANDAAVAA